MAKKTVGVNVQYEITKENKLLIEVDLNQDNGPSQSGKTIRIASSNGNVRIYNSKNEEVVFGLNVYRYPPEK